MESPLLKITGLTKTYSGVTVLNGVSFSVERNSILGLIGENGAGKSTLIKCINGVVSPDCGTLFFNGREYRPEISAALKNGIVTIPQEFNLADTLTVRENIFLGRELKRHGFLNPSAMRRETQRLLDELRSDLSPDAPVETLSIAQKQLVEIARAVSRECRLLIMDEPFVGLDPKAAHLLKGMMRELCDAGGAIFFSTHVLEVAEKLCDKVAIIKGGKLIRSGTMEEVKGDDSLEQVFLELEGEAC